MGPWAGRWGTPANPALSLWVSLSSSVKQGGSFQGLWGPSGLQPAVPKLPSLGQASPAGLCGICFPSRLHHEPACGELSQAASLSVSPRPD